MILPSAMYIQYTTKILISDGKNSSEPGNPPIKGEKCYTEMIIQEALTLNVIPVFNLKVIFEFSLQVVPIHQMKFGNVRMLLRLFSNMATVCMQLSSPTKTALSVRCTWKNSA